MSKLARYIPITYKNKNGEYRASVRQKPYGKYVLFEDHVVKVTKLRNQIAKQEDLMTRIRSLEEENEKLRMFYTAGDWQ